MMRNLTAMRWTVRMVAGGVAAFAAISCSDRSMPTVAQLGAAAQVVSANRVAPGRNLTPRVRHVFVIALENESFDETFGPNSPAPYLADSLPRAGAFLRQYFGTGHFSLDNYISMISGQAPDSATSADCGIYSDFVLTGWAANGQAIGNGCVYPRSVRTIADQLMDRHLTWRGYMEDMGNDPAHEPARCGHVPLGTVDITNHAEPNDQYADRHDPFVYFHSIIDSPVCQTNVVPLTELAADLQNPGRTPNFVFITPNVCHDGHDSPCVDGEPGGLLSADEFLKQWVPAITRSRAFQDDGLLIVTFDEADAGDATACCNEQSGPNVAMPGRRGPGGGRTGTVLLSPFITPGTVSDVGYNHYSMLKSLEDIFGLPYLGYAGQAGLVPFGSDVYTRPNGREHRHRGRGATE
jgi:phosphatidylinositol-3-phosphatase